MNWITKTKQEITDSELTQPRQKQPQLIIQFMTEGNFLSFEK